MPRLTPCPAESMEMTSIQAFDDWQIGIVFSDPPLFSCSISVLGIAVDSPMLATALPIIVK